MLRGNRGPSDIVWNLSGYHHQILRLIFRIDVDEVFDHCQRKMFERIYQTSTRARPASAKMISAFSVQWIFRIKFTQDSVDSSQLTPPYAMRPRTFSTVRAPSSVSINSSGVPPPSARLGLLSHRV